MTAADETIFFTFFHIIISSYPFTAKKLPSKRANLILCAEKHGCGYLYPAAVSPPAPLFDYLFNCGCVFSFLQPVLPDLPLLPGQLLCKVLLP